MPEAARAPAVDVLQLGLDLLRNAGLRVVQVVTNGGVGCDLGGGEAAAPHGRRGSALARHLWLVSFLSSAELNEL